MPAYSAALGPTAIYSGDSVAVWNNETPAPGTSSLAVALGAPPAKNLQASVEFAFAANPGAFQIDIEDADTDTAGSYVTKGSVTSGLNSSFTTRAEIGYPFSAKLMRLTLVSRANSVALTAKVSLG